MDQHGLSMVFPKVEPKTRLRMQVVYLRGDHGNHKERSIRSKPRKGKRTTEGFFIGVTTVGNGSPFLLVHWQRPEKCAEDVLKVSG